MRTISPPLALVATTEHVSVSRNGDEPQEEHLADWLSTQRSRRGTISHKTVKKRCRDNQSRGRPRIDPSALAPARDPQDLVHSTMECPRYRVEKHQLNRAAVVAITPLGSRITVFPRGSGPRTLRMCVYLVCMELIRGAQPRSDCPMLCVDLSCLDPRTVTGETFCLVLRPAHPASCIVPHDVFKWSTPAVSSSSDRVPDHLTVGRNLHMKNAGTITSTPGRSVWFSKASMARSTHGVEPWSLCCCQTSRASWVRGNDAREPLHDTDDSTQVRVGEGVRTTRRRENGRDERNRI